MAENGHGPQNNFKILDMERVKHMRCLSTFSIRHVLLMILVILLEGIVVAHGSDISESGKIYVNNNELIETESPIFRDDEVLLPLRSILENIGATVTWNQDLYEINIEYNANSYICKFWDKDTSNRYITIENNDIINGALGKYVKLEPMSGSGSYEIINDRVYLPQKTFEYLLTEFNCVLKINFEQNGVYVNQIQSESSAPYGQNN